MNLDASMCKLCLKNMFIRLKLLDLDVLKADLKKEMEKAETSHVRLTFMNGDKHTAPCPQNMAGAWGDEEHCTIKAKKSQLELLK